MSDIKRTRREEMRDQAQQFHDAHPEVWVMFERFALEKMLAGCKHYGIGGIWERIRWETNQGDATTAKFKLNNNHRAFYARRFMVMHPQHAGFFRTRHQTSEDEPATDLPPLSPTDFPTWPQGSERVAP